LGFAAVILQTPAAEPKELGAALGTLVAFVGVTVGRVPAVGALEGCLGPPLPKQKDIYMRGRLVYAFLWLVQLFINSIITLQSAP